MTGTAPAGRRSRRTSAGNRSGSLSGAPASYSGRSPALRTDGTLASGSRHGPPGTSARSRSRGSAAPATASCGSAPARYASAAPTVHCCPGWAADKTCHDRRARDGAPGCSARRNCTSHSPHPARPPPNIPWRQRSPRFPPWCAKSGAPARCPVAAAATSGRSAPTAASRPARHPQAPACAPRSPRSARPSAGSAPLRALSAAPAESCPGRAASRSGCRCAPARRSAPHPRHADRRLPPARRRSRSSGLRGRRSSHCSVHGKGRPVQAALYPLSRSQQGRR
jgi:hypothetical protein